MFRPVLLAVLVVCSLGVAAQPAAGDLFSETTTPDGADDPERDDADRESDGDGTGDGDGRSAETDGEDGDDRDERWYDRWGSDRENRSAENRSSDENSSEYWSDDDPDRDDADDGQDDRDGDGTDDGASERDADRPDDTTGDDDHHANGSGDDRAREDDGSDGRDRWELPLNDTRWELPLNDTRWELPLNDTVYVLDATGAIDDEVPGARNGAVGVDRGSGDEPRSGEVAAGLDLQGVPPVAPVEKDVDLTEIELHSSQADASLLLDIVTDDGVLNVSPLLGDSATGDGSDRDGRSTAGTGPAAGQDRGADSARTAAAGEDGSTPSAADETVEPAPDDGTGDDRDGSAPAGGAPAGGGPGGAGAAMVVTVGCLGGTRVAVTQANLLVAPATDGTVATLHRVVDDHLAGLSDLVPPAVLGYSRRDGSDPLENETRADIYDLVRDSPGIYHAKLAEETGVAVETVRYHCRVLDEEGLVEPRKHRGKRRLYPVSMGDDDPELGAAMADSAAADVLSAIERLEPATLSAVAEHVGCAPSTVTYHLDRLEEDGLVTRERDGGAVQVRLRRDARSALQTSVADD